jgi:hypothetical protein
VRNGGQRLAFSAQSVRIAAGIEQEPNGRQVAFAHREPQWQLIPRQPAIVFQHDPQRGGCARACRADRIPDIARPATPLAPRLFRLQLDRPDELDCTGTRHAVTLHQVRDAHDADAPRMTR